MNRRRNRHPLQALIFLLVLALLSVGGYVIGRHLEESNDVEVRSEMTEGFGKYEEKIFQGDTYYKKTGLTTLLLMGIDRDSTGEQFMYRDGGQADFLLLLVIDHDGNVVRQLQVNRDTMS